MPEQGQSLEKNTATGGYRQIFASIKLRPLHLVIGFLLSIFFLWLAFRQVSLLELWKTLKGLNWRFVGFGFILLIMGTLARAARWRLLYYPEQGQVSFIRLTGLLFISQMLNLVIPARTGEIARIALIDPGKAPRTLGTIAVEKLLDLITLLAFILVIPLAVAPPEWFQNARQSFLVLTLSLFGVSMLLFLFKAKLISLLGILLKILPYKWGQRIQKAINQALAGLDVFGSPWIGVRLQAWSFLIWGLGAWVNLILFRAFSLPLPLSAAIFLLLVLQVGITVPSIPGKLGVFQYLVILALSVFGVEREFALSYSLVLYVVAFGPLIIFGTIFGLKEWSRWREKLRTEDR